MTSEELEVMVRVMKEYVDAMIVELKAGVIAELAQQTQPGMADVWLNEQFQAWAQGVEDRLNHPAMVLDYRAWVIETAAGLGVSVRELLDAKKRLEAEAGVDGGDRT